MFAVTLMLKNKIKNQPSSENWRAGQEKSKISRARGSPRNILIRIMAELMPAHTSHARTFTRSQEEEIHTVQ